MYSSSQTAVWIWKLLLSKRYIVVAIQHKKVNEQKHIILIYTGLLGCLRNILSI